MDKAEIKNVHKAALISLALTASFAILAPAGFCQGTFPGVGDKAAWLKANGFFDEGNRLLQMKKFAEATDKFKSAIAIYPSDYNYHFNLGLALKKQGNVADAVDAFKQATAINKMDWKSWKALGNSLYKLGRMTEAVDAYKSCLACNPPAKELKEINDGIRASTAAIRQP